MNIKAENLPSLSLLEQGECPVKWALKCVDTAWKEGCGLDVMCRDAMAQLHIIITDIATGKGRDGDIDLIQEICTLVTESAGCEISQNGAAAVLYSIEHKPDEWDLHCRRHRCTALECESYYSVYIDPSLCKGCHYCLKTAPMGAVASGEGMISVIKDDSGLKTAEFLSSCPNGAIKKAGVLKPRLPQEPIPIGSSEDGGGGGGARRRRRRRGSEA